MLEAVSKINEWRILYFNSIVQFFKGDTLRFKINGGGTFIFFVIFGDPPPPQLILTPPFINFSNFLWDYTEVRKYIIDS